MFSQKLIVADVDFVVYFFLSYFPEAIERKLDIFTNTLVNKTDLFLSYFTFTFARFCNRFVLITVVHNRPTYNYDDSP